MLISTIKKYVYRTICRIRAREYGYMTPTSRLSRNVLVYNKKNLFMYDNTNIDQDAVIMNTRAKFIMKKNSGAAFGLTVVTGGHLSLVGMWFKSIDDKMKDQYDVGHHEDEDIIVEEDVWIASNVTLLKGTHIGRGAVIGSGVCARSVIPPYAMVIGNPAKVVGFKFTPEEIVEHEKSLYPENDRIPKDDLDKNYEKYFTSRVKEIKQYVRI